MKTDISWWTILYRKFPTKPKLNEKRTEDENDEMSYFSRYEHNDQLRKINDKRDPFWHAHVVMTIKWLAGWSFLMKDECSFFNHMMHTKEIISLYKTGIGRPMYVASERVTLSHVMQLLSVFRPLKISFVCRGDCGITDSSTNHSIRLHKNVHSQNNFHDVMFTTEREKNQTGSALRRNSWVYLFFSYQIYLCYSSDKYSLSLVLRRGYRWSIWRLYESRFIIMNFEVLLNNNKWIITFRLFG